MIQGFGQRIQTDFLDTVKYLRGQEIPQDEDQKKEQRIKIGLSATRILSTVGMVVGGILAINAAVICFSNPISAIFLLALGAALFVIGHDVFRMAKNATDNMNLANQVKNEVIGVLNHIKALLEGTKNVNEPLLHPCTNGTFFPAFWSARIETLLKARAQAVAN